MSLMAIYTGLQWLPVWLLQPYETLLLSSSPVIIMLEGLATMVIIITSGQGLADYLFDRSDVLKALLVLACIGIYGVSSLTIFSIYQAGLIKALLDASLVAVSLTLIGVLSVATLMIEHGVLTDAALLFLYVTYNIWTITRSSLSSTATVSHESRSLLGYFANMTWSTAPTQDSLLSMVRTLFQMFSLEMVTGLFIQMSVFLIVSRIIEQTSESEDGKQERSFRLKEWLFNVIWPCFGKAVLILIYTYAWLTHSNHATPPPWYLDPVVWRWANIFACLGLYLKHLLTPPDDEGLIWSLHED